MGSVVKTLPRQECYPVRAIWVGVFLPYPARVMYPDRMGESCQDKEGVGVELLFEVRDSSYSLLKT